MGSARTTLGIGLGIALALAVAAGPAAAQDDGYEAALASGDLASLIPDTVAEAELIPGASFESLLGPSGITPAIDAAREELEAAVDAVGLTLADVQAVNGFGGDGENFTGFGAIRIPGTQASDWFESYYRALEDRNYADPARSLVEVGPKQVLRISERDGSRPMLAYAQGEILWIMRSDGDIASTFLDGLATIDGPALSTDPFAPTGDEPLAIIGVVDDPLSQIPDELLGLETQSQEIPFAVILESIDSADPQTAELADQLVAVLEGVGGVDAAVLITSQAIGPAGGVGISGLHVDGADHTVFADAFVDALTLTEFDDPLREDVTLGGKDVVRISDRGDAFSQPAWVYGVGGTVWILRGQDEFAAALLATMP